jgi:predicted DNA binding CopG/RHH family protein
MLKALKAKASTLDIPYQSLIKILLKKELNLR